MFEVNAKNSVLKFIKKTDSKTRQRLKDIIITLKDNPVPAGIYDVANLKGFDSTYRLRIGSLRLVYDVFWVDKKILLHKIETRESVYESM
ncbi:MAG: type II toxin-antitoxin system RelE/ParE family toxin [Candidatus Nitrosotenuis sp.]|nr:type II toxin-antitoxin system RelE/ParE family toxin [Candidatus Nitrosotenuis sp.]